MFLRSEPHGSEIEGILRQQTITESEPGTPLRDFQTLLEWMGPDVLPTWGKYELQPMAQLEERDTASRSVGNQQSTGNEAEFVGQLTVLWGQPSL